MKGKFRRKTDGNPNMGKDKYPWYIEEENERQSKHGKITFGTLRRRATAVTGRR